MDTFARADLFFMITSVAVVAVSVCLIVALVYAISILHELRSLTQLVRKEGELLSSDLSELRANVKAQGFKWAFLVALLRKLWSRRTARRKQSDK